MNEYKLRTSGYKIQRSLPLGFPIPAINLPKEAQQRLKWFDHYRKHKNISLTCRYFGINSDLALK
jgi:hypothetical protein